MKNIQSIISQMTLEEKAALCTGASAWTTTPVERLGVPELIMSDGPHGVRRVPDVHAMAIKSLPADLLPHCFLSRFDLGRGSDARDGRGPGRRMHRPQCRCHAWPGREYETLPAGRA